MSCDKRAFTAAVREIRAVTKRTEADILNRAARNVAYRAAQFTPKSSVSKIRASLRRGKLLIKLAASQLKREKGRYTRQEHIDRMRKIEKKRTGNVTALRAGWAKGIIDMGGSFRGSKLRATGSAFRGFGRKATPARLLAHLRNAVITTSTTGHQTGAGDIHFMEAALSRAIDLVAKENRAYAQRKIAQQLRRITAK